MHRSVYLSIDLFTRLSIDLAIESHCTYPLLCFKNRCLQELPLRYFPSSAYGCTIRVGDKTDAKRRRYTDGSEKTPSFQCSNDNTGNNKVTCCRLGSTARKDTRSIESRASKTDTCEISHFATEIRKSGNQLLELRTSLLKMPLVLRLPRKMHLCRSPSNLPRLPSFLKMPQHPHVLVTFHSTCHTKRRLNAQNVSETLSF